MQKVIATVAVMVLSVLAAGTLHANFTMFDLSKDAMIIARGEFTGLQRTAMGDRLTLRCDEVIKGDVLAGESIRLEPFERAPADEALGREVIVFCFPLDGVHYFMNHPWGIRSFIFETDDAVDDGLDKNEQSIRNFLAINAEHESYILAELGKRQELKDLGYPGEFSADLIQTWKDELLLQAGWTGTRAARDAAKALCESPLFKGKLTEAELQKIGSALPSSQPGDLGRAYMLELVRTTFSAHPPFEAQITMMREETSQACVGKLANLMSVVENREMVLERVGTLASSSTEPAQSRINALQVLEGLADTDGLTYVHSAIMGELETADFNKDVLRRAFRALRSTPDAVSVPLLNACLEHSVIAESRELTERAWIAYSMVDTAETNQQIRVRYSQAENQVTRKFFQKLLPENKTLRKLIIVHKED